MRSIALARAQRARLALAWERQRRSSALGVDDGTMGFLPLIVPALATIAASAAVASAVDSDVRDAVSDAIDLGLEVGEYVAQAVAIAAPIIGVIPGIGQGIAMALTAAAALALGRPLDEAIIDVVANAVPGGALVKTAVTTAATITKSIIEGDSIEEMALETAREAVRSTPAGDLGAAAFDAGVAVARGQDLQAAGFRFVHHWFRGSDIADKAARFALRVAEGAATGQSVERILLREAKEELSTLPDVVDAQRAIDEGIAALLEEPERFAGSIEDLAYELGIPVEAAKGAFMSVLEDEAGRLTVNHGVRFFLREHVSPDTPIAGEAARIARLVKWTAPKWRHTNPSFWEAGDARPESAEAYKSYYVKPKGLRASASAAFEGSAELARYAPARELVADDEERERVVEPQGEIPKAVVAAAIVALGAGAIMLAKNSAVVRRMLR